MNIIKKERIKNRMKQSELAKKCEVEQSSISRIERNREKPSAQLITKLSTHLNICSAVVFCHFYGKEDCKFKNYCKIKENYEI